MATTANETKATRIETPNAAAARARISQADTLHESQAIAYRGIPTVVDACPVEERRDGLMALIRCESARWLRAGNKGMFIRMAETHDALRAATYGELD